MTDIAIGPGKLDIGQVIQQTFAVIGRNFATLSLLSLILIGIPYAAMAFAQPALSGDLSVTFSPQRIFVAAMFGLAYLLAALILQGALLYAMVQDLDGKRPDLGASLATGLRAFLPLIGLAIVMGVAIMVGAIFLIVPGIMLACAWCVASPVLVAERRGIFGSISRSAELSRGNRWRIFGLFVIAYIAAAVIGLVFAAAFGVFSMVGDEAAMNGLARNPVYIVCNALLQAAQMLVTMAGVSTIYVELRKIKEGTGGRLADIFA